MQDNTRLRKATIKDKKDILKIINFLYLENIPDFVWGDESFIEKQIEKGEYFVAEIDNKIVGIISFKQRENRMYIETIAVLEEYRSQGIGSQLIEFAKRFTKENGLNILRVCSFCEYNAQEFYLNKGFSLFDKLGSYENHKYHRFEIKL
jgi:N-acetylglutamate synthase-like GNAT family acetyltransferase